ncbi:MAG: hypothetical protein C4K58_05645 [Flavobacteriaceae bacterium]|nr:MAG: hypothetical protein C4K58_05645 [Flavobacteriaceae bacterium]
MKLRLDKIKPLVMHCSEVDRFIEESPWREAFLLLQKTLLDFPLVEALKWKQPCYTYKGKNLFILAGFKEYFALSIFNGVLLEKDYPSLVKPGENSQTARYFRFDNLKELEENISLVQSCVFDAIEKEKLGIKPEKAEVPKLEDYLFLAEEISKDKALEKAFLSLTKGRQRAYLMFFDAPQKDQTKTDRIQKYKQRILDGFGMHDCVCGASKKMPGCDGSHKFLK